MEQAGLRNSHSPLLCPSCPARPPRPPTRALALAGYEHTERVARGQQPVVLARLRGAPPGKVRGEQAGLEPGFDRLDQRVGRQALRRGEAGAHLRAVTTARNPSASAHYTQCATCPAVMGVWCVTGLPQHEVMGGQGK